MLRMSRSSSPSGPDPQQGVDDLAGLMGRAFPENAKAGDDAKPCDLPFEQAWNASVPTELRELLISVIGSEEAGSESEAVSGGNGVAHRVGALLEVHFWPWRGCGSREWELTLTRDEAESLASGKRTVLGLCPCPAPGCQRMVRGTSPWCQAHRAFVQEDGSFRDPREQEWRLREAEEADMALLNAHLSGLDVAGAEERPVPDAMRLFVQHLDDMLGAVESGLPGSLEDPASVRLCYGFSLRSDLKTWEVQQHREPGDGGPDWDIVLHREEMAGIGSGQVASIPVKRCAHPGCPMMIRRRSGRCRVHDV